MEEDKEKRFCEWLVSCPHSVLTCLLFSFFWGFAGGGRGGYVDGCLAFLFLSSPLPVLASFLSSCVLLFFLASSCVQFVSRFSFRFFSHSLPSLFLLSFVHFVFFFLIFLCYPFLFLTFSIAFFYFSFFSPSLCCCFLCLASSYFIIFRCIL